MPPSARRISRLVGTPVVEAQSAAPGDEMVEAMIGHACENPPPSDHNPNPSHNTSSPRRCSPADSRAPEQRRSIAQTIGGPHVTESCFHAVAV